MSEGGQVAIPLSQVSIKIVQARLLTCQGAGYGVVIGLGALFAIGMILVTATLKKRGNVDNSEEFTGA